MEEESEPIGTLSDEALAAELHWKECLERHLVSWGHGGKDLVENLDAIRSAIAGLIDERARRQGNNGKNHSVDNGEVKPEADLNPNLAPGGADES